jgi:GntR family transcriptional regulator
MSAARHFHVMPATGVPIYRQLFDQLQQLVASGQLQAGDMLPSVRELGRELAINPLTVAKAWRMAEEAGLVVAERGVGMRVTEQPTTSLRQRRQALDPLIDQLIAQARLAGLGDEDLVSQLRQRLADDGDAS